MIKTKAYFAIKKLVEIEPVLIVIGPRRVGKTTVIKSLAEEDQNGRLYLSADRLPKRDYKNATELVSYLKFEGILKQAHRQIYIDEAHFLTNLGLILKNFFDESKYGVVVTGSGSLKIYEGIGRELVGRKAIYYMYPFDFEDYLLALGKNTKQGLEKVGADVVASDLADFWEWGGYPEVVMAKTREEKMKKQQRVFQTYLDEDVKLLLGKEVFFKFEEVLGYLAKSVGSLLKIDNLRQEMGLTNKSIQRIIEVLDHNFISYHLEPFPLGRADEVKKHRKTYFVDNGLLNFVLRKKLTPVSGKLAENYVLTQLLKKKTEFINLYFWQRRSGNEIDFIRHDMLTNKVTPIEVKEGESENIPRIFETMEKYYGELVEEYVVINKSINKMRKFGQKIVRFVPAYLV